MNNKNLLERVLTTSMDENLRNDILRYLFKGTEKREPSGILRLNYCPSELNYDEIYERMKTVAEGTGVSVARILGISAQAVNNQIMRGTISGKTIVNFCLVTKVSLDWLIGSRNGNYTDYMEETAPNKKYMKTNNHPPTKQYISLVEIYDQHSGNVELKWCLTKHHECLDEDNQAVPGDFNALYSLIVRYKDEAGTPDRVKSGNKRHFQVRRLLAYILGDPQIIRTIDSRAKNLTTAHTSGDIDRPGKTEFRLYSSKYECLKVLRKLAEQNGLTMIKPEVDTIAWDYLIGSGSLSPRDWILKKLKSTMAIEWSEQVTTEETLVGWGYPNESIEHLNANFASIPAEAI